MWHDHFKMLFSSVMSDTNKEFVLNGISAIDNANHLFNVSDIRDVINNMERGKAGALDGICAEHLLYSGDRLPVLLTLLFNMCILHGYLPPQMISTVLIPIIKNKSGDVTDKGNYRPIALSSVISKVFEHIIIDRIFNRFYTQLIISLVLRLNMLRINVYIY